MTPYYQDNLCTIYHGDCREIFPEININADLILTDPPYMIGNKSVGNGKINPWADLVNASSWYELWMGVARKKLTVFGAFWSFLNWRSLVTFQRASTSLDWPIQSLLVWDKDWIGTGGNIGLRPSYELCALWSVGDFAIKDRGIPDVKRVKWSSTKPHGHPAEKPVELIRWLIDISQGQRIIDPFMGVGTTLRAAKDLGRVSVGIEVEERYCEIAARRVSQEALPFNASVGALSQVHSQANLF